MTSVSRIGIYDHHNKLIGTRRLTAAERKAIEPLPNVEFPEVDGWNDPVEGGLWYIIRTQPQWERQLRDRLIRRKLSAYVPLVETLMKGPRYMKRTVLRPLFPGYTFLLGDQPERLDEARGERGVIDFMHVSLRQEGFYVTIPHTEILKLEKSVQVENEKTVSPAKRRHSFKPKDKVVIVDGPFDGFPAEISHVDKAGGITAFISLFGRLTPKEVTADEIRAA